MFSVAQNWWEEAARRDPKSAVCPIMPDDVFDLKGLTAADELAKLVPPSSDLRLVEFGCGMGRVTRYLSGRYGKILALDFSPTMISHVKALGLPDVTTLLSNGTNVPREFDGFADVVYSLAVFMHNRFEAGVEMMVGLAKVLKPDGKMLVHIPVYDVPREPCEPIDVGCWTEDQLRVAASRSGLRVVQFYKNPGTFGYDAVGLNHDKLQVLVKKP